MKKRGLICFLTVLLFCTGCRMQNRQNYAQRQEETPTIRVMCWAAGNTNENRDLDLVNEALGDLTQRKIGCRLEMVYPSNTLDYRLVLGAKEEMDNQADIIGMYEWTYATYRQEGYLLKLDDYLREYGDGIFETFGCEPEELMVSGYSGEEGIYGIPKAMPEIQIKGVAVRRDLLEKYEFSLEEVKELEDLEPFLECIAQEEEITPIVPTVMQNGFFVNEDLDIIGNTGAVVLRGSSEDLKTENLFETPEFEEYILMMKRWRDKGILTDQVGREDELGLNMVVAGKAAAALIPVRPDEMQEWLGIYGDQIAIQGFDMKPFLTTHNKWQYNWCVNSTCKYPELAVQALELMYTDPEVNNLMLYGIKDLHYIVDQNGFFSYPEGMNSENAGYFTNEKWQFNRKIGGLWKGMSAHQRWEMEIFNSQAVYSPAYGFILEEESIGAELARINQIISESYTSIQAGFGEGEKTLKEFQKRIEDAGFTKVQQEVERQLREWKAES